MRIANKSALFLIDYNTFLIFTVTAHMLAVQEGVRRRPALDYEGRPRAKGVRGGKRENERVGASRRGRGEAENVEGRVSGYTVRVPKTGTVA